MFAQQQPPLKRSRTEAALPSGWEEFHDDGTGLPYWHNAATGETTWERPAARPKPPPPAGPPPRPQQPPPPQKPQWERHHDDEHGIPYWYNAATGESTWEDPTGGAQQQSPPPGGRGGGGKGWSAPANGSGGGAVVPRSPGGVAPGAGAAAAAGRVGAGPGPGNLSGRVAQYNPDRGFGFIRPDDGSGDIFCHCTAFGASKHSKAYLVVGEVVYFIPPVVNDKDGRLITRRVWGPAVDSGPEPGQLRGTCVTWSGGKGFGFIQPEDNSDQVFVHVSAMAAPKGRGRMIVGKTCYYAPPVENPRKPGTLITKRCTGPACDTEYDPSNERAAVAQYSAPMEVPQICAPAEDQWSAPGAAAQPPEAQQAWQPAQANQGWQPQQGWG